MNDTIKNFCLFIVIAALIKYISYLIVSDFIMTFLKSNIITIQLGLFAVNTATLSVIMTKLKEISVKYKASFPSTVPAMKSSVVEQVALIVFSFVLLVFLGASKEFFTHFFTICDVLLISVFIASVQILYDTAMGIFVIIEYENNSD